MKTFKTDIIYLECSGFQMHSRLILVVCLHHTIIHYKPKVHISVVYGHPSAVTMSVSAASEEYSFQLLLPNLFNSFCAVCPFNIQIFN